MNRFDLDRRKFLQFAGVGLAAVGLGTSGQGELMAAEPKRSLKKAVKYAMIKVPNAFD